MDLSYAYLNTRVKGMEARLLPEALFKQLLQVGSIDEMIALLEETKLKHAFVDASTRFHGISLVEEALNVELVDALKLIRRNLPKKDLPLFDLVESEFHALNLKKIVSAKALGKSVSMSDLIVFSNSFDYRPLLAASDLKALIPFLRLNRGFFNGKTKSESPDFRLVLKEIDREFYQKLSWLSGRGDYKAKQIISARLELLNAMLVLRSKHLNIETNLFFKNHFIKSLSESVSLEDAVKKAIEKYGLTQEEQAVAGKSLSFLEMVLERKLMSKVMRETRLSIMSFSSVLGFIYLKQVELGNIRKIAYAKLFAMPELNEFVFAIN